MASVDPYMLVAAIDFGTTYSGYAFSFRSNEKSIHVNKNWGAATSFQSYKAPTSVLTTKSGEFKAFGYEAEIAYSQALEEDGDGEANKPEMTFGQALEEDGDGDNEANKPDMLLFRHFKMMLHKQEALKLSATICSVDGTLVKAVDIFAHAIRYLKNHMLEAIKNETGSVPNPEDIRWVLTVPAIWGEVAKQFMREAAHLAGCIEERASDKLVIALEPEAASLCCRSMHLAQYNDEKDISFSEGTKYLVLDCGGGTVDITAHIIGKDEKIRELVQASGGPWGGIQVDKKFRAFLDENLGKQFMNTYVEKCPHEWFRLLNEFETAKKAIKSNAPAKINVSIPYQMAELFQEMKDKSFVKALKEIQGVKCSSGMISFQPEIATNFFNDVISEIVNHVRQLYRNRQLSQLNYIFMVGGFGECRVLQDAIRTEFEMNGTKVLIPSEAQMAIIKGAILFGHNPQSISTRVLRHTYGCAYAPTFNEKIHDKARKMLSPDGKEICDNVFDKFVEKGAFVDVDESIFKEYGTYKNLDKMEFRICATDKEVDDGKVHYTDEPGYDILGKIEVETTGSDKFQLILKFGETEIFAEAIDMATSKKEQANINFL